MPWWWRRPGSWPPWLQATVGTVLIFYGVVVEQPALYSVGAFILGWGLARDSDPRGPA